MRRIELLDQWPPLCKGLKAKGYKLFQMQYGHDRPEGFHAAFMSGNSKIEILTYNRDIQEAIIIYNQA